MDGEHAIHVAEVKADAAAGRVDLAFERGAGAEGDHRHALGGAQAHNLLHLFGGLRKDHGIRRLVADPGQCVAVLLADRLRGDEAIADHSRELGDDGLDRVAVPSEFLPGFGQCHRGCSFAAKWPRRRWRSSLWPSAFASRAKSATLATAQPLIQ